MENNVLKNKIVPWQKKGRWYHARLILNPETFEWSIVKEFSDDYLNQLSSETQNSGLTVANSINTEVIDYKCIVHNRALCNCRFTYAIRIFEDGPTRVMLPDYEAITTDYDLPILDVYIFINQE